MNGYCGDCDKQIEFHEGNIEKKKIIFSTEIYLICPWCNQKELITAVEE